MNLSEGQKTLIEANRIKAQEIRKQRAQNLTASTTCGNEPAQITNSYNTKYQDIVPGRNRTFSHTNSPHKYDNIIDNVTRPPNEQSNSPITVDNKIDNSDLKKDAYQKLSIQQKIEENRKRAVALRALKNQSSEQSSSAKEKIKSSEDTSQIKEIKYISSSTNQPLYDRPVHVATCCLMNAKRFFVATKFHSQLIALIKQMPSRQYDSSSSRWSLDLEEHDTFIESTQILQPQVKVDSLPKFIISCLNGANKVAISISPSNLLLEKLLPFQKKGVEYALSLKGRALIADDMGLGKTLQALCVMQEYRQEWPLLIICPSSLRLTWSEAITTWLHDVFVDDINILFKGSDIIGRELVTIVSYDLLTKFELLKKFKCAIADESHFIKSGKTARCKATVSILQETKRCILLSGTPALSRPIELYTQLQCIDRRKMPQFKEYGLRYCEGKKTNWGWDYTGHSNLEELNIFISSNFMIRRLKKDVLDQLPGKTRKKILIETKSSKSLNSKALSANSASKADYQACFFEYYSETALAKLPGVLSYVKELLESDKKLLLFAHHKTMMQGVRDHLSKEGVNFIMIDGTTLSEKRQELCNKFQTDATCLVALLSLTAANTGFTLTAADTVVFSELFYNPGTLQQAEDRVHRIGQTSSVVIHYLVARRTSDDTMWPMIEAKLSVLGNMGVGGGDFGQVECSEYDIKDDKQLDIMNFFQPSKSKSDELPISDMPSSKKAKRF